MSDVMGISEKLESLGIKIVDICNYSYAGDIDSLYSLIRIILVCNEETLDEVIKVFYHYGYETKSGGCDSRTDRRIYIFRKVRV